MLLFRNHAPVLSLFIVPAIACSAGSDTLYSSATGGAEPSAKASSGQGGATNSASASSSGGDGGNSFANSSSATGGSGGDDCEAKLAMTVRDFSQSHPDFETFGGSEAFKGLVEMQLGVDNKPVYAHPGPTQQTTGPTEFQQWYNDAPGVNQTFTVEVPLTETEPGRFIYDNSAFFPIDNMGFGNEGFPNNFHFTTEVHTSFEYKGGEVFTFSGDDDLWLFINEKLAIDLGGLHPELSDSIELDAVAASLGITKGGTYSMDIFHAERRYNQSNFHIETTIDCFKPTDPK